MIAVAFLSASYDGLMVNYSSPLDCPGFYRQSPIEFSRSRSAAQRDPGVLFIAGDSMLRLSVESCDYFLSVEGGIAGRQISATASIPEGIVVNDSLFSGPVHVVISDKSIDPPFEHGSIYWDIDASGAAFASLWLYAPAETIDRMADKASTLQQLNVSTAGVLVNGGTWSDSKNAAAVSRFGCCFDGIKR
jgi:hypothetical protein